VVRVTARPSPIARRRRLGVELRRLRVASGLTIDKVAEELEFSAAKLSRIETGHVGVSPRDVRDMLALYGVAEEQRDKLMEVARQAREKGWWHAYSDVHSSPYIGLENAADQIRIYEALLVPGLLQTPAYARAVIQALHPNLRTHQVDRWIELREVRQALLKQDDPPSIAVILDEDVLRRPVGGRKVMQEQLRRLLVDSAMDTVTLQVLPLEVGEHAGMYGSFTILGFRDPAQQDLVYLENATKELYLEGDEELQRYTRAFERLSAAAHGVEASAALLAKLSEEL
jgi:transcriptional regulator with XRE-family HTH domain